MTDNQGMDLKILIFFCDASPKQHRNADGHPANGSSGLTLDERNGCTLHRDSLASRRRIDVALNDDTKAPRRTNCRGKGSF
jgi:hypothetical protein